MKNELLTVYDLLQNTESDLYNEFHFRFFVKISDSFKVAVS